MEDRGALLRELHRRVLSKVMGSEISDFEFTEDKVLPYFRQRLGFVATKDDLLGLVRRAGPIRVLKEKGRNVYPYTVAGRESVDAWSAELVQEGAISSVYIDDAYFVPTEDLPIYLAVLSKDRPRSELEEQGPAMSWPEPRTPQELAARLDVPERQGPPDPPEAGGGRLGRTGGLPRRQVAVPGPGGGEEAAARMPWTRSWSAIWNASPRPPPRRSPSPSVWAIEEVRQTARRPGPGGPGVQGALPGLGARAVHAPPRLPPSQDQQSERLRPQHGGGVPPLQAGPVVRLDRRAVRQLRGHRHAPRRLPSREGLPAQGLGGACAAPGGCSWAGSFGEG